jgi:hypothetical protein
VEEARHKEPHMARFQACERLGLVIVCLLIHKNYGIIHSPPKDGSYVDELHLKKAAFKNE